MFSCFSMENFDGVCGCLDLLFEVVGRIGIKGFAVDLVQYAFNLEKPVIKCRAEGFNSAFQVVFFNRVVFNFLKCFFSFSKSVLHIGLQGINTIEYWLELERFFEVVDSAFNNGDTSVDGVHDWLEIETLWRPLILESMSAIRWLMAPLQV